MSNTSWLIWFFSRRRIALYLLLIAVNSRSLELQETQGIHSFGSVLCLWGKARNPADWLKIVYQNVNHLWYVAQSSFQFQSRLFTTFLFGCAYYGSASKGRTNTQILLVRCNLIEKWILVCFDQTMPALSRFGYRQQNCIWGDCY